MPIDRDDVGLGWTSQGGAPLPAEDQLPGQVYHVSQLPDRERQARELGGNYPELYDNVGGTLTVYEDKAEALSHPNGPEPGELRAAEERAEVVRGFAQAREKQAEETEEAPRDEQSGKVQDPVQRADVTHDAGKAAPPAPAAAKSADNKGAKN